MAVETGGVLGTSATEIEANITNPNTQVATPPPTQGKPYGGGTINIDLSKGTLKNLHSSINWLTININSFLDPFIPPQALTENPNTQVKLLLKPGDISDSVSVSMSRRFESSLPYTDLMAQMAAPIVGNDLSMCLSFKYDASGLKKIITLNWIYPVASSSLSPQDIRTSLSKLQGLVFPRGMGFLYPPLLSLNLAGLYRGAVGFVTAVDIIAKEDWLGNSDSAMPEVIEGSIKFENLFNYFWSNDISAEKFNLHNGSVLFGNGGGGGIGSSANTISDVSGGGNTPEPPAASPAKINPIEEGKQQVVQAGMNYGTGDPKVVELLKGR